MVTTNVIEVLPDGAITEIELLILNGISVRLKRTGMDELFSIQNVDVLSDNEETLTKALNEINIVLADNGVKALKVFDLKGNPVVVNI